MKILGLMCSPRKGGNTEILMNEALEGARSAGAETELIFVADKNIAPCDGCETCHKTGQCRTKDDMQDIYEKMEAADGIIFGTPVYFTNVSAQAKIIIDRTYAFLVSGKLKGKVAGALIAVRRVGAGQVLGLLYTYFAGQRMISAGGAIGYG
ncbi:MAG: flavodoxin family protein, partial [Pseudomonadota bacterium]